MKREFMKKIVVALVLFLLCPFFSSSLNAEDGEITGGPAQERGLETSVVDFDLVNIETEVICLEEVVNIYNVGVYSDEKIESLEYSLDGGITWVTLELTESYNDILFDLPSVPFEEGLLVFNLRAVVDDQEYVSVDRYIPTSCGEALIFGYYFENNDEPAIVTQSGDVLFNANHNLKIFVESSYGVSEVRVSDGEDSFSLNYDYTTRLWSGVIPSDFVSERRNSLEVVGRAGDDLVKKSLPRIFNTKKYTPELGELYGGYEIYYFDNHNWSLVDYCDDIDYPVFTLLPGKYYVKLEKERGWFYSVIFEIDEKSIVSLNAVEGEFPIFLRWFERYFTSMDAVIFDSAFYSSQHEIQDVTGVGDFISDNQKDAIVMYMNRWNPWYNQTLRLLENFADGRNVVLIADENNFMSLSSALKDRGDFFELHEVKDSSVLRNFLTYQPQIVYYQASQEEYHVVFSLQSFVNLQNRLNNLGMD